VCFRYRAAAEDALDALNERLMHAVNASGDLFLSHTKIDGRFALRLAIGNLRTQRADVEFAWDALRREARRLQ
jgi:aromatic-L-amino-acid decarboxylase